MQKTASTFWIRPLVPQVRDLCLPYVYRVMWEHAACMVITLSSNLLNGQNIIRVTAPKQSPVQIRWLTNCIICDVIVDGQIISTSILKNLSNMQAQGHQNIRCNGNGVISCVFPQMKSLIHMRICPPCYGQESLVHSHSHTVSMGTNKQ